MKPIAEVCRSSVESALDHYGLPKTESAIRLLCMIIAHESGGFTYCKQVRGPALSLYQIEPPSYLDVCKYAERRGFLKDELPSPPERLIFDFQFATGIARVFLLRIPAAIPPEDQLMELAKYAKRYWNTELGKATPELYFQAYKKHFT